MQRQRANMSKAENPSLDLWADFVKIPGRVAGTSQADFDLAIDEMLKSTMNPGPGSRLPVFDEIDLDLDPTASRSGRRSGRSAKRQRRRSFGRDRQTFQDSREDASDSREDGSDSGEDFGGSGEDLGSDDVVQGDTEDGDEGGDGDDVEYEVEAIVGERGPPTAKMYLVRWVGYPETTWEAGAEFENSIALAKYLRPH